MNRNSNSARAAQLSCSGKKQQQKKNNARRRTTIISMATNGDSGNKKAANNKESNHVSVYPEEQVDIRSLYDEAEQLREENTKLRKVNEDEREEEESLIECKRLCR